MLLEILPWMLVHDVIAGFVLTFVLHGLQAEPCTDNLKHILRKVVRQFLELN